MDEAFQSAATSNLFKSIYDPVLAKISKEITSMKDVDKELRKLETCTEEGQELLCVILPPSHSPEAEKLLDFCHHEADRLANYCHRADILFEVIDNKMKKQKLKQSASTSSKPVRKILKSPANWTIPHQILDLQAKIIVEIKALKPQVNKIQQAKITDEIKALEPQVNRIQQIEHPLPEKPSSKGLKFIGREEDVLFIIKELTCLEKTDSNGVSIVGMRGVGKTALADHIINHEEVKNKFPIILRAFMSGYIFCIEDLFSKLIVVHGDKPNDGLCESHLLKGKEWLIMFDDLAELPLMKWRNFQNSYLGEGGKILITTLSSQVGETARTTLHILKPLSEEHCQDLISQELTDSHSYFRNDPSICSALAKKSCGLPLVATFLAFSLRKKEDKCLINQDLRWWPRFSREVRPILISSSASLDTELKRCFAYFFLFPQDYQFCREDLIHLWIGEGLIKPHISSLEHDASVSSLEQIGQRFFNELLHRSILQPQPSGSGALERYKRWV